MVQVLVQAKRTSGMKKQIDKLQMLITLEKGIFAENLKHQKKQALLVAMAVLFLMLIILSVNVAIFCHISELNEYAKSAWILAGINVLLAIIPTVLIFSTRQKSAPETAAYEIREALIAELKGNIEAGVTDINHSIDKIQEVSQDIKTFTEGGLNALIPIIKMASGVIDKKRKKKSETKELKDEQT